MFKRAFSSFLTIGIIVGLTSSPVQAVPDGNIACSGGGYFRVSNNKLIAKETADNTSANKCRGTAVVPEGITEIGNYGLADEEFMTNVSLPNSLTKIGGNGLAGTRLSSINLPPFLTELAQGALQYNGYLTSLVIPPLVAQIGTFMVFGSYGLCDIYFLGSNAPTVDSATFAQICKSTPWVPGAPVGNGSPKAWVPEGATSYPAINSDFGGLTVQNGGAILLFDANGADSGSLPPTQVLPIGTEITVAGNIWDLIRVNYRFIGWCTSKLDDGSGVCFEEGDTVVVPEGTTILYVNWQGKPKVTYEGNGATGGNVPVDSLSPYEEESSVTVLGNSGSLERSGYSFGGWAPTQDGSGTLRQAGDTFDIGTTNTKLFAKWIANTNTVSFDSDGGSVVANGSFVTGGQLIAPVAPTRDGYNFDGWSPGDGAPTIAFPYSPTATESITLYAVWSIKTTGTVTYSGNGNSSGAVPVDGGSPYLFGSTVTASSNSGSLARAGYKFVGWNTAENGSGTSYGATGSATFVLPASDVILFAVWALIPVEVKQPETKQVVTTASTAVEIKVRFPFGSSALSKSNRLALKKLVAKNGTSSAYIITGGVGDQAGVSSKHEKQLAKNRNKAIASYLAKLEVPKSNITITSKVFRIGVIPKTKIISKFLLSD